MESSTQRASTYLLHHAPAAQVQPHQQLRTSSHQVPRLAVLPLRHPGGLGDEAAYVGSSKVGRGAQPGPWKRASISTCGILTNSLTVAARVVLPAPEVPAIIMRFGHPGSGS